jgi:AcrR family transcriptional regulator
VDANEAEDRREGRGNIRDLLIQTALAMVQEEGVDAIRVREVARRAGVSSGAPFRHFRDRNALLQAIADEGHRSLWEASAAAMAAANPDPIDKLRALGVASVRFAADHPAHFRVMHLPGLEASEEMLRGNEAKREMMRGLILEAQRAGYMRPVDPTLILLACVASTYGLARFFVDGFVCCPVDPMSAVDATVDQLITSIVDLVGEGFVTSKYWDEHPR